MELNKKQLARNNLQKERRQRGHDFQKEMRRSWRLIPNCWRVRIQEGDAGSRPGDELILLESINILAEHKRTQGRKFELNFLRPSQIEGLVDFDEILDRNLGLVFISFLNETEKLDETYALRLITALKYMKQARRLHIKLDELQRKTIACIKLPLLDDLPERTYDLRKLIKCYKLL